MHVALMFIPLGYNVLTVYVAHIGTGPRIIVSSERLEKRGVEHAILNW